MSKQQRIFDLIKELTGQKNVLTIPKRFVDLTGDLHSALMLSQSIYWTDRTKDPNGWFYKSGKEWREEFGVTRYRIDKAIERLTDLGLMETEKRMANGAPTIHYRIDIDKLLEALGFAEGEQKPPDSICRRSAKRFAEGEQNDLLKVSESITETTTETTKKKNSPAAKADGAAPAEQPPKFAVGDAVVTHGLCDGGDGPDMPSGEHGVITAMRERDDKPGKYLFSVAWDNGREFRELGSHELEPAPRFKVGDTVSVRDADTHDDVLFTGRVWSWGRDNGATYYNVMKDAGDLSTGWSEHHLEALTPAPADPPTPPKFQIGDSVIWRGLQLKIKDILGSVFIGEWGYLVNIANNEDLVAPESELISNDPVSTPPDPPPAKAKKARKGKEDPIFEFVLKAQYGLDYDPDNPPQKNIKSHVGLITSALKGVNATADELAEALTWHTTGRGGDKPLTKPTAVHRWATMVVEWRESKQATSSEVRYANGMTRAELIAQLEAA